MRVVGEVSGVQDRNPITLSVSYDPIVSGEGWDVYSAHVGMFHIFCFRSISMQRVLITCIGF